MSGGMGTTEMERGGLRASLAGGWLWGGVRGGQGTCGEVVR